MMTRRLYIAFVARTKAKASTTRGTSSVGANQVRRYRRIAEFTQAELAEAIEVSRQTIVSIEKGDYSPSVHLALRIAAVLNASVEDLFGDDEKEAKS